MIANTEDKITSKEVKDKINYKMIGNHMKNIRKEKGLTQSEIAASMGVSVNFYAALEGGANKANLSRLLQFAAITNVSMNRLVARSYPGLGHTNDTSSLVCDQRKAFDQLLAGCSDEMFVALYETCCTLLKHLKE